MTALDRATAAQRREALRIERASQRALTDAYRAVLARLQGDLDALTTRIAATQAAGETVGASWLDRDSRYRALIAQTEAEIGRYSRNAEAVIANGQRQAATAALGTSEAVMAAALGTPPPGVVATFNRLPTGAIEELVGNLGDGRPLSDLLDGLGAEASKAGRTALIEGLGKGLSPRQLAIKFRVGTNESAVRALRISRQEINRAYRDTSLANYRANSDVVTGWRWLCAGGKRTCGLCYAMSGKEFRLDQPFASHVACFTAGHVVSGPPVIGSTTRWYTGDLVKIVTASGNLLSVTPNHPILTPQGWVAAGLLKEGDDVLCSTEFQRKGATVNPDKHHVPALIEDVARAIGGDGGVITRSVPTTAEDFHGDGIEAEVCVVRADRLLHGRVVSDVRDPLLQEEFIGGSVGLVPLSSQSELVPMLQCMRTSGGAMGGGAVASVLFDGSTRHHQTIGVGAIADRYASLDQAWANGGPGYAERLSQSVLGLPSLVSLDEFSDGDGITICADCLSLLGADLITGGLVAPHAPLAQEVAETIRPDMVPSGDSLAAFAGNVVADRIVETSVVSFAGHVYNLQTTEGWYVSNGIITHNCRCTVLPITRDIPGYTSLPQSDDGPTVFARLTEAEQRGILGRGKYELFKGDDWDWDDLVAQTRDARWGAGRRERALYELAARQALAAD